MTAPDDAVTRCLEDLAGGDASAIDRLMPLIYDDLRRLAGVVQGRERHSLNPTALVHEAYARIAAAGARSYDGRRHFLRVAAMAMRQLLADYARAQSRDKRGGTGRAVTLVTNAAVAEDDDHGIDVIALNDALDRFAELYPRQARVVELRFLAGLSVEETAGVLEVSTRTVKGDWQMARAWLSRELAASFG